MKTRNSSKVLAAVILFAVLAVYGCGGGGGGNDTTKGVSLRVLAKNVLFRSALASAAPSKASSYEIYTTTKVLAENVVVETTNNALTSDNLQSALDNEMAINLSTLLPGTAWSITNKTSDVTYKGTTGQVTFSDGTFSIDQGRFAAAGSFSINSIPTGFCTPTTPYSYEMLSNSIMYVTWSDLCGSEIYERSSAITIIANDKNIITMLGFGGAGEVVARISVLTKIP